MSDFESWHKALEKVRGERKGFYDDLLRMEGKYETLSTSSNQVDRNFATAFLWLARETKIRESEDLSVLEFLLNEFDKQAKEIDTLRRVVSTLDISDSSLKTDIDNIKTWKERREELLNEIEKNAEKRRRFFDENK